VQFPVFPHVLELSRFDRHPAHLLSEAAARVLAAALSLVVGWGSSAPSLKLLGAALIAIGSAGLTCPRRVYLAVR
jgi:hypothetical protein